MKKVIMVGMMLDGYKVTIEKGEKFFCVVTECYGSYESKGGLKTLQEARQYYRNKIQEIREQKEWEIKMGLR